MLAAGVAKTEMRSPGARLEVTARNDESIAPFDGDENGIARPGHLGHALPCEPWPSLDLRFDDHATGIGALEPGEHCH